MCVSSGRIGVYKECATERGNRNAQERIKVKGGRSVKEKENGKDREKERERVGGQRRGITEGMSKPE